MFLILRARALLLEMKKMNNEVSLPFGDKIIYFWRNKNGEINSFTPLDTDFNYSKFASSDM